MSDPAVKIVPIRKERKTPSIGCLTIHNITWHKGKESEENAAMALRVLKPAKQTMQDFAKVILSELADTKIKERLK